MKKLFFACLILLLLFALSGCNSYKYKKFNDNLSYGEILSNSDKEELLKKVKEKWVDFSKVEVKEVSEYESDTTNLKINTKYKIQKYSNDLFTINGKQSIKSKTNGISINQDRVINISVWNYLYRKKVINATDTGEGIVYSVVYDYFIDGGAYASDNTYLEALNIIGDETKKIENLDAYREKNGKYAFVFSNGTNGDSHANKIGTLYSQSKTQIIYIVNKKYEIEKVLYYYSLDTNRDPDTSNWYSKIRRVSFSAMEFKISYGSVKSNSELVDALNNAYEESLK